REREQESETAKTERTSVGRLEAAAPLEERPARHAEQYREQEGRCAKQHEQQVRDPGAERSDQVSDRARLPGRGECWVGPVVARERDEKDQCERGEDPKGAFAQATRPPCGQAARFGVFYISSRH